MKTLSVAAVYDRRRNTKARSFAVSAVIDRRYRLMFAVLAAVSMAGCSSAVTPEKMAQVTVGMKTADVEKILGRPAHIDQSETTGLRGEVYDFSGVNGTGRVIILNDIVFKAEFVPGGKSS
jgi:hypothetical protein